MNKKKIDFKLPFMLILLILVIFLGLAFGSVKINWKDVFSFSGQSFIIVYKLRLPRVLGACCSGMALACAGLLLQKANDNDLASPTIMGCNAGAGLFVMMILCFLPTAFFMLPIAAFVGALIAVFVVLAIAQKGTRHNASGNIVLAGVAISSLFNGGIALLSQLYPDAVGSYVYFSTGGFNGVGYKDLWIPAILIVICLYLAMRLSSQISLLCLGDDLASNLAVNVKKVRIESILLASCLTACSVSYAGLLGFVGLLVPHIANKLVGNEMKKLLVSCCLLGSILVVVADLIGRWVFAPSEISAGVILSFIGAPFFIYLLLRKRR